MSAAADDKFLAALTAALTTAAKDDPPNTTAFTQAMDKVLPVFDYMGSVLSFAKKDMIVKNESLKEVVNTFPDLAKLVEADKKAGTMTKKNSLARNLHRLRTVVHFIKQIMFLLAKDQQVSLSTAVSEAYSVTLAAYHGTIVRGTCQAGFLLLPTRETFLESIGETEATSVVSVNAVVPAAEAVMKSIDQLYGGVDMPVSTAWF